MSQYVIKKPEIDLAAMEGEIRRRLVRGKARLLVSHVLVFMLTLALILFVI